MAIEFALPACASPARKQNEAWGFILYDNNNFGEEKL